MNTVSPPVRPCPSMADSPLKRRKWWMELESQWRAAFGFVIFGHANQPTDDELENLWQAPVLRFAGPRSAYPNLNFELTNCSGLSGMSNLDILVLTNHRLESIHEVATIPDLKSLFVNNNAIRSLAGIEPLKKLEQLYAQANQLESLEPMRSLTNLREIYVSVNSLTSLDGLTRKHGSLLKAFFCLPNEHLTDREIMRVERNLGIRCRSL